MKVVERRRYRFVNLGFYGGAKEVAEALIEWYAGGGAPVLVLMGPGPDLTGTLLVAARNGGGVEALLQVISTVPLPRANEVCEGVEAPLSGAALAELEGVVAECCPGETCDPFFLYGAHVAVHLVLRLLADSLRSRERVAAHLLKAMRRGVEEANARLCCMARRLAEAAEARLAEEVPP